MLPKNVEVGGEWLESLYANSHCLRGCEHLRNAVLTPEEMELTEKFRPIVKRITTNHIP
jgi:hypothetical protein